MSADASLYRLEVQGLPADAFLVLRFQGGESISGGSWSRILALSHERGLDHDELIGHAAHFTVGPDGGHHRRGVIAEFHEEPFGDGLARYEILVRSRLSLLEHTAHCRVFQNLSVVEILARLLQEAGFDGRTLRSALVREHAPHPLRVQYNESDYDFLSRTAESAGIFHFEIEEGDAPVLVLADDNAAFPVSAQKEPMEYRPGAGLVEESADALYALRRTGRMHSGRMRLLGYDAATPSEVLRGVSEGPGHGEWTRYETALRGLPEAGAASRIAREARLSGRESLAGASHNRHLRAGTRFTISQAKGAGFGGDYLLVEVLHEGSQEGAVLGNGEDAHYRNTFVAQPCALPYRPPARTPRPRIAGVLVAKVDGPDGPYAHIDDEGRYRARLPFDEGDSPAGQATPPIRLAQPYAGPGYGLHFPLHKGADLVLAFEDGDIDRPIALGAAPNPQQKSPAAAANRTESVLRTASGHRLALDDLEGKTRVALDSAGGRHLVLDDTPDSAGILLETANRHRLRIGDREGVLELSVGDGAHGLRIALEGGEVRLSTKAGHLIHLSDRDEAAGLQTAAGHQVRIDDAAGLISLQDASGKHAIQIDAGGTVSLSTAGDLELQAEGALRMKAREVSLESTGGAIALKSSAALDLQGRSIALHGDQKIQVESGTDVAVKAGTNLKLEGSINVESKAGMANKVTGTMANLEASGVSTIKGAMVLIN